MRRRRVRPCDIDEEQRRRVFMHALSHQLLMELDYPSEGHGVRVVAIDLDGRTTHDEVARMMALPEPVRTLLSEHVESVTTRDHDGATLTYTKVGW